MKKIISLAMSLIMIFSAVLTVSAADVITDIASEDAVLFENYVNDDNFDKNYFFLGELVKSETAKSGSFKIKITTNSEKELNLAIGMVKDGVASNFKILDLTQGYVDVKSTTVKKDAVTELIVARKTYGDWAGAKFGVAVLNSEDITEPETFVKVETVTCVVNIGTTQEEGVTVTDYDTIDSFQHTFPVPVTFVTEGLEAMAAVLTAIELQQDFTTEEAIAAVKAMSDVTSIEEADKNILNAKLTNDVLQMLADKIAEDSSITINKKAGAVELPWIALSANATDYALEVNENKTLIHPNYEVTKAYNITIKADNDEISYPAFKQKVIIDIPNGWEPSSVEYASYNDLTSQWDTSKKVELDGQTAVFYVDHFSTYALLGKKIAADENNAASSVKFTMEQNAENKKEFALYIEAEGDGKQINNFVAAAMKYEFYITDSVLDGATPMKNFTYDIKKENGISIKRENIDGNGNNIIGGFKLVATVDNPDENPISGTKIKIATVTINGTGSFYYVSNSFEESDATMGKNIMYCETITDNGVVRVDVANNHNSQGNIEVFEIPVLKKNLKIKVDFNAQLKDDKGNYKDEYSGLYIDEKYANDADYIGMTLVVTGSESGEVVNVKLGDAEKMPITIKKAGTQVTEAYAETIGDSWDLPANEAYTFEISGKGYRTFYGDVFLDADKTVYIWNNAYDKGHEVNVVTDDDDTKEAVAFLVGDIYMDGIVDVYDLSAVTSYFNKTVGAAGSDTYNKYIPYDLNRDGKISLTDIAYVQASYGN